MLEKTDWELLPKYYFGKNEPVGIWINRNFEVLLFSGFRIIKEKATIQDGIQDVATNLCELKKVQRPERFRPNQENIQGALRLRLKNRLIDIVRSNTRRRELIEANRTIIQPTIIENPTEDFFEINLEKLKSFKKELPSEEEQFIDLMLKYGQGKLSPIMEELGITKKQARTTKQRIIRKINRELVNPSK